MLATYARFLIAVFALSLVVNVAILAANLRGGRHASLICILGGVFGAIGFALLPALCSYWWIPLLVEPGTMLLFIAMPAMLSEAWKTSRFRLVSAYRAEAGRRRVVIRLFRRDIFVLEITVRRDRGEFGMMTMSLVGTWSLDGDSLTLRIGDHEAAFSIDGPEGGTLIQLRGFPDLESNIETSLAGLRFESAESGGSARRP